MLKLCQSSTSFGISLSRTMSIESDNLDNW